ncbi:unnamed protein product [Linum tenue]|uniref:Uncharacterized protein n=1 Tax=Linum tenue TaxID=586396 RepID=A0AAV0IV03_9ROSI|nr:unnamed protein product [Linum tenue]
MRGGRSNSQLPPYCCLLLLLSTAATFQCCCSALAPPSAGGAWEMSKVEFDTGGLSRKSFPKGFLFGTATSAYQVEGMASKDGRGPSIWDDFIRRPGVVANNANGEVAVDQYHRYKISCQNMFLQVIGFSINLFRNDYADYADFCFKTFGDRVKNWMTFNEPRVTAALGYDNGIFAPGRLGNSGTEPYIVAHNLILAHATAVQRYREKYQEKQKGKIGTLLDFVWYEPLTRGKADNYAAQRARDFHIGWYIVVLSLLLVMC